MIENADLNELKNEDEVMSNALISEKMNSIVREMQNNDLMILSASLILISELRNQF